MLECAGLTCAQLPGKGGEPGRKAGSPLPATPQDHRDTEQGQVRPEDDILGSLKNLTELNRLNPTTLKINGSPLAPAERQLKGSI